MKSGDAPELNASSLRVASLLGPHDMQLENMGKCKCIAISTLPLKWGPLKCLENMGKMRILVLFL